MTTMKTIALTIGLVLASAATVLAFPPAQATTDSSKTQAAGECPSCEPGQSPAPVQFTAAEDKEKLPEGHPPLGGATGNGKLPQGHPPMGTGTGTAGKLPQGHPPMGTGAGGQLPQGHPPMGTGGGQPGALKSAVGSIVVRVAQGTEDGPKVGNLKAKVEMMASNGQPVATYEADVDKAGMALIDKVELPPMALKPVVSVTYKDVTYSANGAAMHPGATDQMIRLNVYEPTDEKPAMEVEMHHVIVRYGPQGLLVTEVVALKSLADRTWMGVETGEAATSPDEAAENAEKQTHSTRATVSVPVPKNAIDVRVADGFSACCTKIEPGLITSMTPVMPGGTTYRIGYYLPIEDGKAELEFPHNLDVKQLVVFTPSDQSKVAATVLQGGEPMNMGRTVVRMFKAENVTTDQTPVLKFENIPEFGQPAAAGVDQTSQAAPAGPATKTSRGPKLVAGIGAGTILVAAAAVVAFKTVRKTQAPAA